MRWWRDRRIRVDLDEGREAVDALRAAEARWPEVRRLSMELTRRSKDNHFAEMIEAAITGVYPKPKDPEK